MQVGAVSGQETYYHVYRGRQAWFYRLDGRNRKVTGAKAGQAAFVLKPR